MRPVSASGVPGRDGCPVRRGCYFVRQIEASRPFFGRLAVGCRKSGLRHFFEVFIAPLRLRRGQGAMQGNPCYARLFADLPYMPPNPIKASGGQSRAPPVAGEARRKPSEQGSARKAPRADAARPLRTALRPPNPQGFFDRLRRAARFSGGSPYGWRGAGRSAGGRRGRIAPTKQGPLARPCKTPPPPAQTLQQRSWQPGKGRRKGASWRRLPWRQGGRWDARGGGAAPRPPALALGTDHLGAAMPAGKKNKKEH